MAVVLRLPWLSSKTLRTRPPLLQRNLHRRNQGGTPLRSFGSAAFPDFRYDMSSFLPEKLHSAALEGLPANDRQRFLSLLQLQQRILTQLQQQLALSPPATNDNGFLQTTSFDGKASVCVQTYQGQQVELFTTGWAAFSTPFPTGYTSSFAWMNASTDAPHLSVEIVLYGEKALLFVHFNPRKDLVLDTSYLEKYYAKPAAGCKLSLNDLDGSCAKKEGWAAFRSPQPLVRCTAAGLALSYLIPAGDLEAAGKVAQEAVQLWLALVGDAAAVPPVEQEALAKRDAVLRYNAVWGDAYFVNMGGLYGEAALAEMGELLTGMPKPGSGKA